MELVFTPHNDIANRLPRFGLIQASALIFNDRYTA
tara:strand:- start:47 stop:151 length:105 start_codon:yes stop_codon:yes gene_type:complete